MKVPVEQIQRSITSPAKCPKSSDIFKLKKLRFKVDRHGGINNDISIIAEKFCLCAQRVFVIKLA